MLPYPLGFWFAYTFQLIKQESQTCRVSLFSNSTLLTEEIAEKLVQSGLDSYEFSLDGSDKEVINQIRKGSDLSQIIENIKILNKVKRQYCSTTPYIMATCVLHARNYMQLPDVVNIAEELGVCRLNVNGLEPYTTKLLEDPLWYPPNIPEDLVSALEEAIRLSENKGIVLGLSSFGPDSPGCNEGSSPLILANGDVTVCGVLAYDRDYFFKINNNEICKETGSNKRKIFGNAFTQDLHEIWLNPEFLQFREKLKKGYFPDECGQCLIKHKLICVRSNISAKDIVSSLKKQLG